MKTRYYILLLAAFACSLPSFANAEDARISVSLADLDLSKPAGAEVLYGRIRSAARTVCQLHESRLLRDKALSRACYRSAIEDAVARVNRPLLTELHVRATGKEGEVIRSVKR